MFGLKQSLTDPSLYTLHDIAENEIVSLEKALINCQPIETQRIAQLKNQIDYYKKEIELFDLEIKRQRESNFQFSVEELYNMYGQFEDRFISIEFHKGSDSAKKYGRNVGGVIRYFKSERENLEKMFQSGNISRTNGLTKIEVTANYNLSAEHNKELFEKGFYSGDIFQILATNMSVEKKFGSYGIKNIPNTIKVNFDPTGVDICKMELIVLVNRLNSNPILIKTEWEKLFGYLQYYNPTSNIFHSFRLKGLQEMFGWQDSRIRSYELKAKIENNKATDVEGSEYESLSAQVYKERIEILKEEIRCSTNRSLVDFAKEYPSIYRAICFSIITFEDSTLDFGKDCFPIFWDYQSYIHIYLRHCQELQIEGHFENKTKFQYTPKDIRRVLVMAIEKLRDSIDNRLKEGLHFSVYGNKSYYFNGNYYCLRVEPNGRVSSFYPLAIK